MVEFNRGEYQLSQLLLQFWNRLVETQILSDEELNQKFQQFFEVFELVHNKIGFLTSYGQQLASRMITNGHINVKRERMLITKLIQMYS